MLLNIIGEFYFQYNIEYCIFKYVFIKLICIHNIMNTHDSIVNLNNIFVYRK